MSQAVELGAWMSSRHKCCAICSASDRSGIPFLFQTHSKRHFDHPLAIEAVLFTEVPRAFKGLDFLFIGSSFLPSLKF